MDNELFRYTVYFTMTSVIGEVPQQTKIITVDRTDGTTRFIIITLFAVLSLPEHSFFLAYLHVTQKSWSLSTDTVTSDLL